MSEPTVFLSGTKLWFSGIQLHNTDGPAIIRADGSQMWYHNGLLHRTNGPARLLTGRTPKWYVWGNQYFTNKSYQAVANLNNEEMAIIVIKYGNVS